jgi:nicotinamide mononucleotide transporter
MGRILQNLIKNKYFLDQFSGWRKGEVLWLCSCVILILCLSVSLGDGVLGTTAAVTGMMYTILAGKGKLSCFLFGLINTPLYAYLSFKFGYYGDAALNLYYFAMMFPAFFAWKKNISESGKDEIIKVRLSCRERFVILLVAFFAVTILWLILFSFGGKRPFCDAMTNVFSVMAMYLTARRAIEQWYLWISVNAIEIFMWWKVWTESGSSISLLLMWMLFLANGIYLLCLWKRDMAKCKLNMRLK